MKCLVCDKLVRPPMTAVHEEDDALPKGYACDPCAEDLRRVNAELRADDLKRRAPHLSVVK